MLEHQDRRHSPTTLLEDTLAQCGSDDGLIPADAIDAGLASLPLSLFSVSVLLWVQSVLAGHHCPFPDKVCHDVHPFLIPAQDSGPELIRLVWLQFTLKRTAYSSQGESEDWSLSAGDGGGSPAHVLDTSREEGAYEVSTSDVDVGEVGRICFYNVLLDTG